MSFKREGNDGSQLNVLRKRRVADLLASYIPEDEALLMTNGRCVIQIGRLLQTYFDRRVDPDFSFKVICSDLIGTTWNQLNLKKNPGQYKHSQWVHIILGPVLFGLLYFVHSYRKLRYACTVCHHRPVFDTIDMLSIHRNGKKHTASLQSLYGKKMELRNEVQKRKHQEYVRAEEAGEQLPKGPAPLLAQTRRIAHHALLKSAPYNSCCSRKRPGDAGKEIGSPELSAPPPSSLMSHTSQLVSEWPGPQEAEAVQSEPAGRSKGPKTKKSVRRKKKDRKCPGKGEEPPSDEPEKKREMDHYLHLRSAGWIPDGSGKWVKDENVEFDSDEEEPPPMPPP